ncbi:hypothetical protein EHQ81_00525 [Leptospira selangorensis]|uniref:Uncharacterized protein n=1 Tax=Leptospira selangorensis TaxID=2484982 RepID=A0A5F2C2I9_9LEPT|nr:hypothetical protein [Leptospira selangorensis]TGM17031.1 hypothetical protein EHQ81_00525 [Leptospira selangorensis]TGM21369.1 hypothetical protein EHQ82_10270 [Leptospira selangorensis]
MVNFRIWILALVLSSLYWTANSVSGVSPEQPKDSKTSEPSPKKEKPSKTQGCCRIKYEGGGIDYFPSTEEECVAKSGFQSFEKNSALCFQSLWD